MKEKKNFSKWLYYFTMILSLIIIYKVLDDIDRVTSFITGFIYVLMPFIIAIIIAYLFYTPSNKLEKILKKNKILRKKARVISTISVYLISILVLFFIVKGIVPIVVNSVTEIVKTLPDYYRWLLNMYDSLDENSIIRNIDLHSIIAKLSEIDIMKYITISNISQYINGAISIVSIVFNVLVSFIFSIYLLIGRHDIKRFFVKLTRAIFPENLSRNIIEYVGKTNQIFLNFIYCQILDGIIIGIILSIAFSLLEIKYGVLLGILIGAMNIIPYFGAIIAIFIAVCITLFTGGLEKAIVMLVVAIVLQQIDSNIINPHILGEGLKVSPILIIFAVTVGGAYFGVLGMFLAVPIAAILKIILEDYMDYRLKQKSK